MLSKLFSPMIAKVLSGIAVTLLVITAVQTSRLNSARKDIAALTAQLALADAANDRMIDEGKRRTEAGREALQQAKRETAAIDSQIDRIRAEPGNDRCLTPVSIMEAEGL